MMGFSGATAMKKNYLINLPYEGTLSNGMKIQMRLDPHDKIKTAYPIY